VCKPEAEKDEEGERENKRARGDFKINIGAT
jgi:hypothetical protein